ncbi:hypothetical protein NECAME_07973 [Necator americanus]|uniref:Uncharacterized protein n=1 Tax=Necator americanus TaxID=51031 RepID=W2TN26_NECAM|nr:hypothetical protein NECAME_07973 [Necator americanus]ETN82397.1 hypothetical protein NECAME_07973 [Necator americanus]
MFVSKRMSSANFSYLLVFINAVLLYSNTLSADFVYDDRLSRVRRHTCKLGKGAATEDNQHQRRRQLMDYVVRVKTAQQVRRGQAIVSNPVVNGDVNIFRVWNVDFWGNPLNKASHKSYRPLTTLSFRINAVVFGMRPFS